MEILACILVLVLIGAIELIGKIAKSVGRTLLLIAKTMKTEKQEYSERQIQKIEQQSEISSVCYQRVMNTQSIKEYLEDYDASVKTLEAIISTKKRQMEFQHPTPQEELESLKENFDRRTRGAIESYTKYLTGQILNFYKQNPKKQVEEFNTFQAQCELLKCRCVSQGTLFCAQDAIRNLSTVVSIAQEIDFLKSAADQMETYIAELRPYEEMDFSAPNNEKQTITVPIEATYKLSFFVRMFLLRNHTIKSQIVSQFDMIQYQVPISALNEELIILTYGTHFLESVFDLDGLKPERGTSQCQNTFSDIMQFCPILSVIKKVSVLRKTAHNPTLISENSNYKRFNNYLSVFWNWYRECMAKATSEYKKQIAHQVKWVNEYRLFRMVAVWYPDAIFQYSPSWLEGQRLDIFIPSQNTGIEYQGKQHFRAIEYFGGEDTYQQNLERDKAKAVKCSKNGVHICYWTYEKDVTFSAVEQFLREKADDINAVLEREIPMPVANLLIPASTYAKTHAELAEGSGMKRKKSSVIRQYTSSGEFVAEYRSIQDAATGCGRSVSSIQKCLVNQRSTAGGFIWKREDANTFTEHTEIVPHHITRQREINLGSPKRILQVDSDTGDVISEFESIAQAAKTMGISKKGISDVLHGRQKTAAGYQWVAVEK